MNARRCLLFVCMLLVLGAASSASAQEVGARRGWLGFSYASGKGETGEGIRIEAVHPGSPAAQAGLRAGDLIVRWNGTTDVVRALASLELEPGEAVRLRVRREGERDRDLLIEAGERPRTIAFVLPPVGARPPGVSPEEWERVQEQLRRTQRDVERAFRERARAGAWQADSLARHWGERIRIDSLAFRADSLHKGLRLMLRDSLGPQLEILRGQLRELVPSTSPTVISLGSRSVAGAEFEEMSEGLSGYFGTDDGALVLKVSPGTPADRAGLRPGDVVLEANGVDIDSVDDLREVLVRTQRSRTRSVLLDILRERQRQEVELRWE